MKSFLKLDRRYDVDRLLADLQTAERVGTNHLHWSKNHDGGWGAIPLISLGGGTHGDALKMGKGRFEKTPILKQCPYLEEIIDGFDCPKQRVRLMRLEPGTNIREHRDRGDSWALGQIRIHVPIVTHDEVYFYVDGHRVLMRPGEVWYCDFSRPHWVANRGPIARVHLVLDLLVSPSVRGLFPRESLLEHLGNWAYWCQYHGREGAIKVSQAVGLGRIKRRLRRLATVGPSAS